MPSWKFWTTITRIACFLWNCEETRIVAWKIEKILNRMKQEIPYWKKADIGDEIARVENKHKRKSIFPKQEPLCTSRSSIRFSSKRLTLGRNRSYKWSRRSFRSRSRRWALTRSRPSLRRLSCARAARLSCECSRHSLARSLGNFSGRTNRSPAWEGSGRSRECERPALRGLEDEGSFWETSREDSVEEEEKEAKSKWSKRAKHNFKRFLRNSRKFFNKKLNDV